MSGKSTTPESQWILTPDQEAGDWATGKQEHIKEALRIILCGHRRSLCPTSSSMLCFPVVVMFLVCDHGTFLARADYLPSRLFWRIKILRIEKILACELCFTNLRKQGAFSASCTEQHLFSSESTHCGTIGGGIWRGFGGVQGLRSPGNIYLICWGSDTCICWYRQDKKMKNTSFAPNSLLVHVRVRLCCARVTQIHTWRHMTPHAATHDASLLTSAVQGQNDWGSREREGSCAAFNKCQTDVQTLDAGVLLSN